MIMRRTRRKYRKNIIELSAFRIWRCYGLNLMRLPENHVLNTRPLTCGGILRSMEPSRRKSWLTEAGDLGGILKVMPILGSDCVSVRSCHHELFPTWHDALRCSWNKEPKWILLPSSCFCQIFLTVTRIWTNTCGEEKLGSQSRP